MGSDSEDVPCDGMDSSLGQAILILEFPVGGSLTCFFPKRRIAGISAYCLSIIDVTFLYSGYVGIISNKIYSPHTCFLPFILLL